MSTPERKRLEAKFFLALRARLAKGDVEYGDKSFDSPLLPEEILEEIVDIAGWAFVLWVQMQERLGRLETAARALDAHPRNRTSR